jgi:lysyl-tRNA synthetase, class I
MPLCNVPSPDGKAKNYAEYFAQEFIQVIEKTGFYPEFYRSSEIYKSGRYNEVIKLVLGNSDKIREIYKRVSGAVKADDWMPVQVVCEKCGKIGTTKVISFDGEKVKYICEENLVKWVKGCGYHGEISPWNGNAKLPWKVEWAAKFKVLDVNIEGAGKDHSTRGGSREISEAISREVFGHVPPFNIPYEFFQVGGKKMSSSKGAGSSSAEIAELLPPELLRLLLISKEPNKVIDFIPDGDTIPVLYDNYDRLAEAYFTEGENDYERIFYLSHTLDQRKEIKKRFFPRFSQVAFLVQMEHMDKIEALEKMKEAPLLEEDRKEYEYRAGYAEKWLKNYAPEDFRFELQEKEIPEMAKNFSADQKKALLLLLDFIKSKDQLDGQELHTKLHDIKKETGIAPKDFFSAIYFSFLGKDHGPKAGWFLSVMNKKFLEKRLLEVIK